MSDVDVLEQTGTAGNEKRPQRLTRQELYELVWKEPMLRIGERLGVSSSYMARVCADLRVPRPPRGYWAQLEFGKSVPERPPLPPVRPGDATEWSPGTALSVPVRHPPSALPLRSAGEPRAVRRSAAEDRHELLMGARPNFLKTRKTEDGLLRPFKRLLVDIVVSEKQLDAALDATNALFQALEAKGHRVTFAAPAAHMRRAEFDERETSNKNHYHRMIWSPDRVTVVYVGDVPIGLTLFETTEEIEVVYDRGTYVPVRDLSALQLRRYQGPQHWRTKQSGASGRFCLQAYCPNWMVAWTKQWRAETAMQLVPQVGKIVAELEAIGPVLAAQVVEAEAKAEAQRKQWEEEERRRREEQERVRRLKLRDQAKEELLSAIEDWGRVRRVHDWIGNVETELSKLAESDRALVMKRLQQAKMLIGDADPLALLRRWKAPEERF